jgi:hypothetical protein
LGRRNLSRRLLPPPSRRQPNPNGLPQPIRVRVRVRGGAAPSTATSPVHRTPWLPALGGGPPPYKLYPLLSNTSIPFFPNSHLLSWYDEIELDLDSSRFHLVVQRFVHRLLYSLPSSEPRVGFSTPCRAVPCAPAPLLSTASPVRTGLLSGLRHDRPPQPHRHRGCRPG